MSSIAAFTNVCPNISFERACLLDALAEIGQVDWTKANSPFDEHALKIMFEERYTIEEIEAYQGQPDHFFVMIMPNKTGESSLTNFPYTDIPYKELYDRIGEDKTGESSITLIPYKKLFQRILEKYKTRLSCALLVLIAVQRTIKSSG
jgi:hypothetical protein